VRCWMLVLAVSLSATAATIANAAESLKKNQPGVILTVEKKAHTRIQYYVVNTPVTTDEPYFEAEIDSAGFVYTAEYEPRTADENLPDGCLAGQAVQVRVDHRHLFVQCLNATSELSWRIVKRKASAPDSSAPKKN
jgi:hypothetical protein